MKKLIPLFFILFSLLLSCKNYKEEFAQVSLERDSLIYAADLKDSSLRLFMKAFDEIEANLDTITQKQKALEKDSLQIAEIKTDQRDRINDDIAIINRMLERNRKLISDLQQQNKLKNNRIAEFQVLADNLRQQVESKEAELIPLKAQLDEKQQHLETLKLQTDSITTNNSSLENQLKEKIEKLNTAYYIIDNIKTLRSYNILDSKGGFLGIGKNQLLKQDFKTDNFTKINIEETTSIPLDCKEAKIITNHPSDSYTFVKEGDIIKSISIKDFDKFWGASKYLVIAKN
ncbi:MAG: hypothetical protein ABIT08_17545 [Bacteroidia bacterium]